MEIKGWHLAAALAVAMGCGSSSNNSPPQVSINNIKAGQVVNLSPSDTTEVDFTASNFSLKPTGNCGTEANCGQAYLNVDGDSCNTPGQPYNTITPTVAATSTSKLYADFSLCPAATFSGNHQLTVSLRRDDGTEVIGAGNAPAEATVSIIVTGGTQPTDGGNP